ncbi:MAG: cupin domain-containing protein [Gemmatimonadaceae bacterium]
MPNINTPEFNDSREHAGFRARRAKVGHQAGAVKTGLSYWEVDPGEAAYPYHAHLTEEEIVVILEGTASLRSPEGWRELSQGEVAVFPTGEAGAHQIVNKSDAPLRFLSFSNSGDPEIVIQLDAQKYGVRDGGSQTTEWFRRGDAVEYFEGVARNDDA